MKKFLRELLLFALLPMIAAGMVVFSELDRQFAWTSLPGDCENRGAWIYHRLFTDTTPVDIAILGTSRTINGVQDTLISRLLTEHNHRKTNVANLGYCRFGSELQYIIAKDLLGQKKVDLLVLEVNERMSVSGHPVYPYYASTEDLLCPASFANSTLLSDYYQGFLARVTQMREQIYSSDSIVEIHGPAYGYRGFPAGDPPESLIPPDPDEVYDPPLFRSLSTHYTRSWIEAIASLCAKHKVPICFLYLSSFHDQLEPVEGTEFYMQFGPLLIPPASLREKKYWRENDHMNDDGGQHLSEWLARALTEL